MSTTTSPRHLADLGPIDQLRAGRMAERSARLLLGLWLYGTSIALMVEGAVGAAPWDVFHLGASGHVPWSFGAVIVATSAVVLLAWIPIRQRPGVGTVLNAALVGPFADANLALLPSPGSRPVQVACALAGVATCAFATALYVGAQLGPGPRDGLMTGLARRTGWSIRAVRTGIEVAVLAAGAALGGAIGLGTVGFALGVGPLTQRFLPHLLVPLDASPGRPAPSPLPTPPTHH